MRTPTILRATAWMLFASVSVVAWSRAHAAPAPCAGRFIVQGRALLLTAPASEVDVLQLGGSPYTVDLGFGCGPTQPQLKATRKRTTVRATWSACSGFTGRVRFIATISGACGRVRGTLRAKAVKRSVVALKSRCGDGFRDPVSEACERGGTCPNESACPDDCQCRADTCNPLLAPGAQGCGFQEKCTWITLQGGPDGVGTIGCAPDGTVAVGGACTQGAPGPGTGHDDCRAGLVCVSGECRPICASEGSPCDPGSECQQYSGLFANGSTSPPYGACQASCNPLTQLRTDDRACPQGQGCYVEAGPDRTISSCAPAGTLGIGQQISGTALANSCLPGLEPRRAAENPLVFECGALCQPADVYQGHNESDEGGVAPYTCQARGAAAPSDPVNGESCRYWWRREPFVPPTGPFSNTLGFCLDHAAIQFDSDGDGVPDAPFPRCVNLTTGDVLPPVSTPPESDAEYFGCTALPTPPVALRAANAAPQLIGNWR